MNKMMDEEAAVAEVPIVSASQESRPGTGSENKLEWTDIIKQILVASLIHTTAIQAGINLSFSAVLLPQLRQERQLDLNVDSASWIASLVALTLPLGAFMVGPMMDHFGRKKIAIASTGPFIASWLMHYWAQNVRIIYCARALAGFASGLTTVGLIYVAELSHPRYRSTLLNLNSVFVCFGILLTCILGSYWHWRSMSFCYAILSLSSALAIFTLPESPHWLHTFAHNDPKATKVLRWQYSNENTFSKQLHQLLQHQHHQFREEEEEEVEKGPTIITYSSTKPFLILLGLFFLQQLSGCYVIIFYAVDLFKSLGNNVQYEYKALVLLGCIRFLLAIVSATVALRVGRKKLLIVSAIGMIVTSTVASLYVDAVSRSVCVLLYVASAGFGVTVIPWTLIGELLSVRRRAKMGGILVALTYLFMFGLVKGFPYLLETFALEKLFLCMAIVNALIVIYVFALLPETFGKTFQEIQQCFAHRVQ